MLVSCVSSEQLRVQERSNFYSQSPFTSNSNHGFHNNMQQMNQHHFRPNHGSGYPQHQNLGGYQRQSSDQSDHEVSCHGFKDGTLIGDIKTNCRKFFTCQSSYPIPLYCPPGKIFDSKFGACSYEHKTRCNYHPVKPLIKIATAAPVPRTAATTTTVATTITTFRP